MPLTTVRGWLPDPPHKNYPLFDQIHGLLATRFCAQADGPHRIPEALPCFDQGPFGACVANAVVGALELVLGNQGAPITPLSRLFLYWLCRHAMHTEGEDSGTYPHLAIERLGRVGVCRESTWGYEEKNLLAPPPPRAYPEASDNRPTGWFRIDQPGAGRLAALSAAVRANHPVVFGTPVGRALETYRKGQVLGIPAARDQIGGHCMLLTGIDTLGGRRVWRVRNSWGPDFGDQGHVLFSDDYMAWSALQDLWVLTRLDPLLF